MAYLKKDQMAHPFITRSLKPDAFVLEIRGKKRWPPLAYAVFFLYFWSLIVFKIAVDNQVKSDLGLAGFCGMLFLLIGATAFLIMAFLWELFGVETLSFQSSQLTHTFGILGILSRRYSYAYTDVSDVKTGATFKARSIGQLRNPLLFKCAFGGVALHLRASTEPVYIGTALPVEHAQPIIDAILSKTRAAIKTPD